MAELVGDDVEIERERHHRTIVVDVAAHLHKAVADDGVIECRQDHDLETVEIARKVPRDRPAEIMFPNREDKADRAEQMRLGEFGRANRNVIEMAVGVGLHRWQDRTIARVADRDRACRTDPRLMP